MLMHDNIFSNSYINILSNEFKGESLNVTNNNFVYVEIRKLYFVVYFR